MTEHSAAERHRISIYRRLTPQQRLRIALELSAMVQEMAVRAIRQQNADISPEALSQELRRRMLSPELFAQVERYLEGRR